MGKMLWSEDGGDEFDKIHSGCISGIFNAQYWNFKILPHRKHEALIKHAKRNKRYKRISDDQDPLEVLKLIDEETSHILVDRSNRKTSSTHKRSLKARIKALVSEETYKNNEQKQDPKFVPTPRLQRTYSIHHLESNEWVHPVIFFPENDKSEESLENATESVASSKRFSHDIDPETKNYGDILEIFKVNKERFANILQDGSQDSNPKAKLTKSGSFPTANKPGRQILRPTKLTDKLNESYTTSKTQKRLDFSSNSHDDLNIARIRRISSLNESSDRYAQLFDFSDNKEAILKPSRSLKLTNGSENGSSFFRRNRSLTRIEDPVSVPITSEDCKCLNQVVDKSDDFSESEHEIEEKVHSELEISEGLNSLNNSQDTLEKEIKKVSNHKHMELSMKHYQDDDDFTYVKQILERSGFIKNGFQQKWFSANQPLDPFVFQEIESQYFHDPQLFVEEFNELSRHLLIFDLVDDVLHNLYEKSLTYYPKELSSFCHIRAAPSGPRVLDEVWKCVSRWIDLKPDMNESLDDIVFRDLGRDDGWMNLQVDSECVALDLEDLILDQILEEVLFE